MPAQIIKSEDGSYKIGGLASTENIDRQNEVLIQKGMDLSPVDEGKGFFNFDHSNKPEDIIGSIDGYKRSKEGLFVYGNLFKGHQRAEAVYAIMKSLDERKKGAVGFSVEGQIIERDAHNPKIIKKCRIKNVALTFNPVNTNTYASLVKSMNVDSEFEFEATKEEIEKALAISQDRGNTAPAELEGGSCMETSNMKAPKEGGYEKLEKEKDKKKKPKMLKSMTMDLYKSNMLTILDKLQVLYPDCSRSELWAAVKERLDTTFPNVTNNNA